MGGSHSQPVLCLPASIPGLGNVAEIRRCQVERDQLQSQLLMLREENRALKELEAKSAGHVHALSAEEIDLMIATGTFTPAAGAPQAFDAAGAGDVFKGTVTSMPGPIAVKLVGCARRGGADTPAGAGKGAEWHERFLHEVQMQAAAGRSQHLVPLLAVCPARLALVYPWAFHGSLRDWLAGAAPPLTPPGAQLSLHWLLGAARGLQVLHDRGLAHGDLRASRVLIFAGPMGSTQGRLAFGAAGGDEAWPEARGDSQGGDARMPCLPHKALPYLDSLRLMGARPSRASDLFAFGVVLLEAMLGQSAQHDGAGGEDAVVQTRGPRPLPLWMMFQKAVAEARRPGLSGSPSNAGDSAAEAFVMIGGCAQSEDADTSTTWAEPVVRDCAGLAAELITAPMGDSRASAPAASQPTIAEVVERLHAAIAAQREAEEEWRRLAAERAAAPPRQRLCVVCMDSQTDACLRPCRHAAICQDCASLCVGRGEGCPICRRKIEGYDIGQFLRTFAA